jgi:aryl sulfotransferase
MSEALAIAWPQKEGEYLDVVMDSTQWNGFAFRAGDVVVATYPKSGTTLTQQIVGQLLRGPDPDLYGSAQHLSPWPDFRPTPGARTVAEAQTGRRYLKTHLPRRNLPISPLAHYVVVMRDPRDVAWSFHHHLTGFRPEFRAALDANVWPGGMFIAEDERAYYYAFLEGTTEQVPYWPWVQGWWDVRGLPNVLLVHYADIIGDMAGEIRRIASFIDAPLDEARLAAILPLCTLSHMRKVAASDAWLNHVFKEGANTFINQGTNARWRDVLSAEEVAKADDLARLKLTPDCAAWVMRS